MTWKPTERFFELPKPAPNFGWTIPQPSNDPPFEQKEEDKKAYGIELAKQKAETLGERVTIAKAFFGADASKIMWVANHWHLDPVVIAARNSYVPPPRVLLDKEALAAKLLDCAEEKVEHNGQKRYIVEAKDRLGFYKLYADIMGHTHKPEASINNFASNEMKIVLVKPDEKALPKTIDAVKEVEEVINVTPLRIKAV